MKDFLYCEVRLIRETKLYLLQYEREAGNVYWQTHLRWVFRSDFNYLRPAGLKRSKRFWKRARLSSRWAVVDKSFTQKLADRTTFYVGHLFWTTKPNGRIKAKLLCVSLQSGPSKEQKECFYAMMIENLRLWVGKKPHFSPNFWWFLSTTWFFR